MMEIHDASELMRRISNVSDGARIGQLHPAGRSGNSLVAVDLWELEPGRGSGRTAKPEEQVVYVLSGQGELSGGGSGGAVHLQRDSVVRIDQNETFSFRNTGGETLRLLVVTPLLAWSQRAIGIAPVRVSAEQTEGSRGRPSVETEPTPPTPEPPARLRETSTAQVPPPVPIKDVVPLSESADDEQEAPLPDISGLVKRASELPAGARPERRRPAPEPEPAEQLAPEEAQEQEEEEAPSNLMELLAVFDGGSRGNPGQGYGSFLVQSPNRKPVIKRVEFGDNYTNNQAEYDSLIACLNYIIERLEVTNRSPSMVQLEIKTDSDLVANQLLGNFKVKDAGLRKRHTQALELLDRFALWSIEWQPREETVKLLGH